MIVKYVLADPPVDVISCTSWEFDEDQFQVRTCIPIKNHGISRDTFLVI